MCSVRRYTRKDTTSGRDRVAPARRQQLDGRLCGRCRGGPHSDDDALLREVTPGTLGVARELLDRVFDAANILADQNARGAAHRLVRELRPLALAVRCPKLGLDRKSQAEAPACAFDPMPTSPVPPASFSPQPATRSSRQSCDTLRVCTTPRGRAVMPRVIRGRGDSR
jgi:hypothetical protein